jgi:hypothetical protein
MAFRYDYRNDYKDMNLEQLKSALINDKQRLLNWIGLDDNETKNYVKRVSYLENKINKYNN